MSFLRSSKVQISSKILPQIPNFASFSPSENEALSAVYKCYCCSLILRSLAKTVRGIWLILFSRKKHATAEYWAFWTVVFFCLESHCELADYYIL